MAWLGIAWSLFVYFLFFKIKERKDRIIKITMISYFVVAFIYLILIKNGYFSLILARLGVADNMRLSFWNFFRDSYELSPFYLGKITDKKYRYISNWHFGIFSFIRDCSEHYKRIWQ